MLERTPHREEGWFASGHEGHLCGGLVEEHRRARDDDAATRRSQRRRPRVVDHVQERRDVPDVRGEPVGGARRLTTDPRAARRLLDLVPAVPTPVWGRDELHAGEM